ncbi:MAG: hypothetical protein M3H12_05195, partial [Chromatiales bacterium]
VLTSHQEQVIEDMYVELMKDIYTNSSMTVHLHKESNKINIRRRVRQGDTWDSDIAPETKTKTRRLKRASRPAGQHSPSIATSSRVTLEAA